jgi:hypothetical protein
MAPKRQLTPQEMADLSNMFFELSHDPKTRPYVAKLVEHKFPDRAASFTDVKQSNEVQALRNEIAQRDQLAQAKEMQRALDAQRDRLVESGRYTREQTTEIKQIIDRHGGTLDYDQAAVLYAHEKPPTNPQDAPPLPGRMDARWEFPTVQGRDGKPIPFGDFAKDPNAAAHNAAYAVIDGFMSRPRQRAGAQ